MYILFTHGVLYSQIGVFIVERTLSVHYIFRVFHNIHINLIMFHTKLYRSDTSASHDT